MWAAILVAGLLIIAAMVVGLYVGFGLGQHAEQLRQRTEEY